MREVCNRQAVLLSSPLLTVVIPVHNGAVFLGETLNSIFHQSFQDFEVIIIDDCSTDDLDSVLINVSDTRLTVLHLDQNMGVAEARNRGIAHAKGKYIAFCDADDICHPERFDEQIEFLQQNPSVGVCGSGFTCFADEDLETVFNPRSNEEIRLHLMRGNCFGTSTMMGHAELFRLYLFDQAMSPTEDYDLWTRMASVGVQMANVPKSLVRYRMHAQQVSRVKSVILDQLARKIRALYCARLIGNKILVERMHAETVEFDDIKVAANAIVMFCADNVQFSVNDFRFMLAWMYQKLSQHGPILWWRWTGVQKELKLNLNNNYRFNIALLALLPFENDSKYFDTLIKLKR